MHDHPNYWYKTGRRQMTETLQLENDTLTLVDSSGNGGFMFTRNEGPALAAERRAQRAQTIASVPGAVGDAAQGVSDGAARNAEIRQQAEQERAAAVQSQLDSQRQQQEILNERAAALAAQQAQQAADQRARDQEAADSRLKTQALASEEAAQRAQQQKDQQQAPAPQQIASAQPAGTPRPNLPQPAQPRSGTEQPAQASVRTQPSLSDLTITDIQRHDPNAIDGNVCYVAYTLFNHFTQRVSITVDVDVVSRGLESTPRYADGIGPNMSYTFNHPENIQCRTPDDPNADGPSRGAAIIRAVQ